MLDTILISYLFSATFYPQFLFSNSFYSTFSNNKVIIIKKFTFFPLPNPSSIKPLVFSPQHSNFCILNILNLINFQNLHYNPLPNINDQNNQKLFVAFASKTAFQRTNSNKYGRIRVEFNNIFCNSKYLSIIGNWMNNYSNAESSEYEIQESDHHQQSYQNSLCLKQQKRVRIKLRKDRVYRKKKHGPWCKQEESKFVHYIQMHLKIFQGKQLRRKKKIFRQMEKFIKTRSSEQCRSHHQKYQIRFPCHLEMIEHIHYKLENDYDSFQKTEKISGQKDGRIDVDVSKGLKGRKKEADRRLGQRRSKKGGETVESLGIEGRIVQSERGFKIIEKSSYPLQIEIILNLQIFLG